MSVEQNTSEYYEHPPASKPPSPVAASLSFLIKSHHA